MAFGEKPPKLVDLLEISNFLCKVPCTWGFDPIFRQMSQRVCHLVKRPPKLVDLLEISNFLCKVPCTRLFIQFLKKSCKKYGIW